MAIIPLVGVLLAWTNEAYHLIWVNLRLDISGQIALLDIEYGSYFWLYSFYNNLVAVVCFILLFRTFLRSSHLQRSQATAMLVGLSLAIGANWLYLSGLSPFPHLDLTPYGYSLGGLVMTWGTFRYHLFDIVPVARDKVLEDMHDGVIVLDAQARIVDANPAALHLIGCSVNQVIGQPIRTLLSERLGLSDRLQDVLEAHTQIVIGEGEALRHYDLHISPLQSRRGELAGRVIALHDVTERVLAEEVQRQAKEALRQYAAELEARNEELDAFAHTVAHDIRNPVSQILGYAQLLAEYDDQLSLEERARALRSLIQSGDKLTNIIDELLLLAGVRQVDVQLEPLSMGVIVAEAQQRLRDLIEKSGAEISAPPVEAWPIALGHPAWIEEVWINYIGNACKYGGSPPRVTLGADILPRPSTGEGRGDGFIRFWVRDTGKGIMPQDQARLFAPFTRLDQVRAKGHGLGLSIVRRIVEKLGGEVGVESDGVPGHGSVFSFTLPAAPEGTQLPAAFAQAPRPDS